MSKHIAIGLILWTTACGAAGVGPSAPSSPAPVRASGVGAGSVEAKPAAATAVPTPEPDATEGPLVGRWSQCGPASPEVVDWAARTLRECVAGYEPERRRAVEVWVRVINEEGKTESDATTVGPTGMVANEPLCFFHGSPPPPIAPGCVSAWAWTQAPTGLPVIALEGPVADAMRPRLARMVAACVASPDAAGPWSITLRGDMFVGGGKPVTVRRGSGDPGTAGDCLEGSLVEHAASIGKGKQLVFSFQAP